MGFEHFREMIADPNFIRAFKNTVIINVYKLLFGFTFNVFLALLINEMKIRRVKSVVQTCVYLPYFLSWVIFAGLVQVFLEYPSAADLGGVVNQVIASLGGTPIDFLKTPSMFRGILTISNIIKTAGYSAIVYFAAIAGINPTLYESAAIDGANRKDMMLHITLPRILPSVAVMLILELAGLQPVQQLRTVHGRRALHLYLPHQPGRRHGVRALHGHEPRSQPDGPHRGAHRQQVHRKARRTGHLLKGGTEI